MGTTTGSITGLVTDTDSEGLPGAVIEAVHEPTGTRYDTVTRENGNYRILNVRIGGPYTLTATMTGFRTQEKTDLFVKLGEDLRENFELQLQSVEEGL